MHRIASVSLGFALLLSGVQLYSQTNAAVEKALEANEQAGWQSWKDHNPKPIEATIPDNTINIAAFGHLSFGPMVVNRCTPAYRLVTRVISWYGRECNS